MIDSAYPIARLIRQIVTLGAFSIAPALFAAGGPPPVTINEPVTVRVTGPVEVQGSVEVLNDALKTVFNRSMFAPIPIGLSNELLPFPSIPAGKRLVIETLSVTVEVDATQRARASFSTSGVSTSANALQFAIPLTSQGVFGTREIFVGTQKVRIVVDPRFHVQPVFNVFRTGTTGFVSGSFAGYLEDIPATP